MVGKRDMREMTMEDLFAAGVSPAEIHKLVGKMQEEKREAEKLKETKEKRIAEEVAALDRVCAAFKDYLLLVDAIDENTWKEFELDFKKETRTLALNMKLDKKINEMLKRAQALFFYAVDGDGKGKNEDKARVWRPPHTRYFTRYFTAYLREPQLDYL